MLVVGLTGGIGAGKSSVAQRFAALGVPVLDADQVARELVLPGSAALDRIRQAFGNALVSSSGELDRARLRELVFSDPGLRKQLEAILHPLVRQSIADWLARQQACYVVVVIPLLFESGMQDLVQRVLVVDCDEALQVERVLQRDRLDAATIKAIMAAQWPRRERLAKADDILDNSGTADAAAARISELDRYYRSLC